jgi:hypothetical protein
MIHSVPLRILDKNPVTPPFWGFKVDVFSDASEMDRFSDLPLRKTAAAVHYRSEM